MDAILQRRAAAVLRRDEGEFLADVDPYNKELLAAQKVLFQNLVQFGFGKLAYHQGAPQFDQALIDKYGLTAYLVSAAMEYQIDGINEQPVQTALGYTFVKRSGRYVLVDDSHLDSEYPDSPNQEAWDTGPVLVQRGERTLVVVEAGQTQLATSILSNAQLAIKAVNRWWAPDWKGGTVVIALDDTKVRSTDFAGSDWNGFAAVATSVYRWPADAGDDGSYVVVNPRERGQLDARLLAHEFTHVASAPYGRGVPLWLVEGAAGYVQRMPIYSKQTLDLHEQRDLVRSRYVNKAKALPTNDQFVGLSKDSSYATSWYAVDYLVGKYGLNLVLGLYQELAWQESTPARRDSVMTEQLGRTEQQLFAELKKGR
ncbi:hypothetical protein [Streptomyces sp. SID13031]|uniref:hypothetical protein n=1 Tax=Streptomyces sp. SID13031 TaxID=2706046 RepID=UPI0013C8C5B1|nr:hypothetical protein [Streptomyces sp. SID13031]NEA33930.1 hypothetical protein [Streptomyces sp. SID13031]